MKNDILLEKIKRLHFKREIKTNDLTFNIAPDTGNTWVFHATIKTSKQQKLAQQFAENLGMAISTNSLVKNIFVAWCTNDTYEHILPIELDKWQKQPKL